MKISELIQKLSDISKEHGDLLVYAYDRESDSVVCDVTVEIEEIPTPDTIEICKRVLL